jgi:H+-translocating NAD(P) transhydrogenase subunit alpha
MMSIALAVPKEIMAGEDRVAMTPGLVNRVTALGLTVKVQSGAGDSIAAYDAAYKDAEIVPTAASLYGQCDLVIKLQPPTVKEVSEMKDGSILISFLYPHLHPDTIKELCKRNITSLAMELVPRISRAQDMDALSSQATIAGYKAVLIAADSCKFFFPMLTTAAGSVRPAKVLIIGVGVAGLQAIATARRLGAVVEAYDIRPETEEEVKSLGAKFVKTEIAGVGAGGYARELTDEEKAKQREILKKHVAGSDIIITTAGVPGKKAPRIIAKDMIEGMKPGSVIVDIMAENGGNCELCKAGETVLHNGISIIGTYNISSSLATNASEMYARNIINLLNLLVKDKKINLDFNDEIFAGCTVTHAGNVVNEAVKKLLEDRS